MTSGLVRLVVDREQVRLIDTVRLFQRDPHPGGHRYTLAIEDPGRLLGIMPSSTPSTSEQGAALWAIDSLAATEPGEPSVPARCLLNSVEAIRESDSGLVIEGVCSIPVADD